MDGRVCAKVIVMKYKILVKVKVFFGCYTKRQKHRKKVYCVGWCVWFWNYINFKEIWGDDCSFGEAERMWSHEWFFWVVLRVLEECAYLISVNGIIFPWAKK